MMNKIMFINVPWQSTKENVGEYAIQFSFPLGIGYLAAIASKAGWNVKILDARVKGWKNVTEEDNRFIHGLYWPQIKKQIEDFNPDVVGISCSFSSQGPMVHKVAEIAKQVNKKIIIIAGGAYATSEWEKVIKDENIDFVFLGEAEKTLERFLRDGDPQHIPGVVFIKNDDLVNTGPPERTMNLDEIPFPAYELLPMENYFKAGKEEVAMAGITTNNTASIITSRGCPFTCIFCSIHQTWGRRWRARSPKNVVDEIELLVKKYNVKHLRFEDDNMTLDMRRFGEICDEIIRRELHITWETPNGIRGDRLDLNLAKKMKKAGCKRVRIAIENGDQEFLLNNVNKGLDLNKALDGIRAALNAGLLVECCFIYGIPGESSKTFQKTHDFAIKCLKMGANPSFNIATPLPGTEMYKICEKNGFFTRHPTWVDFMLVRRNPLIKTNEFSPKDILWWYNKTQKDIAKNILLRPWLFFRTTSGANIVANPRKLFVVIKKIYYGWLKPLLSTKNSDASKSETTTKQIS